MQIFYFLYILYPEDASKITKASKIPGYQSLWRKNKPLLKPVTPSKFFPLINSALTSYYKLTIQNSKKVIS